MFLIFEFLISEFDCWFCLFFLFGVCVCGGGGGLFANVKDQFFFVDYVCSRSSCSAVVAEFSFLL